MDRIDLFKRFILESDLIENIQDSPKLLEKELRSRKKNGHVGAILYLEKLAQNKTRFLTESDIKKVQGFITKEQELKRADLKLKPEWIGQYRNVGVTVGGRLCPHYSEIPTRMDKLALEIQEWQNGWEKFPEIQNLAFLADFHYEYERIHPFVDGNGRSGRAIILYLMLYMDKEPFVFTNHDKYLFYYPSFSSENSMVMRSYFYRKTGNLT
ncbi:MAG: Fic family protein [bacterium]|nr:Fic family protein [bacterium]